MTIIELGALGEFLGSIAVLATLVYLAMQIRQNTRTMDESKKLALAQTYQMRSGPERVSCFHPRTVFLKLRELRNSW